MNRIALFLKRYPAVLLLVSAVVLLFVLAGFGILPDRDELTANLTTLYDTYGLLALFLSTLLEGFLFVGMYYIGSALIIAAVLLAQGDVATLFQIVVTVWSALTIVSVVNFTIGRHGHLSMKTPALPTGRLARWTSVLLYMHPTLIAYQAYTRGQDGRSYWSLIPLSAGVFLAGVFFATVITLVAQLVM